MRRLLSSLLVLGLIVLLVSGSLVGCAQEEEEKVLAPPTIELMSVTKEKTTDFTTAQFDSLVAAMGASAYGIQLAIRSATMGMDLYITNPNDFEISLNSILIKVTIDGSSVETPNITEELYVPGGTSVFARVVFTFKPSELVGTLVSFQAKPAAEAMGIAGNVWAKLVDGTATWDVACHATVSSEFGDLAENYVLSWTKPA